MPVDIDLPSLGDVVKIASEAFKDRINPTYDLTLEQHRLTMEETRGDYWYRFTRSYQSPDSSIIGTLSPLFVTTAESASRRGGGMGPVTTSRSLAPFTILSVGRQNQRCFVPMPDGGRVSFTVVEDFTLRVSAAIETSSFLLGTLGGYCRVVVLHPGSRPEPSPCSGTPDHTGQNIMAAVPGGVPMDGPFLLRPYVRRPGNNARTGSSAVFRPARVNWEYWNAVAGFGPVIRHEGYAAQPSNSR